MGRGVELNFEAYIGQLASRGRLDLHIELKEAMEHGTEFGGFSVLTEGITRRAIERCGGLGVMKITTTGRTFAPAIDDDEGAVSAVIVPVWEPDLGLVDLMAFRRHRPALFFARIGYAKCLGGWFADDVRSRTTLWALPSDIHPSLPLFPNPLSWLRAGCQGTVLLHQAWISHVLTGIRSVTAHNERHAASLCRLLTWPGAPKIYLRQHRKAA